MLVLHRWLCWKSQTYPGYAVGRTPGLIVWFSFGRLEAPGEELQCSIGGVQTSTGFHEIRQRAQAQRTADRWQRNRQPPSGIFA